VLSTLFGILLLGLVALAWYAGARARETASAIGRAACENEGYQLLDDSVALQRFGLRWTDAGLRLRRMYRFEYSVDGDRRETGYVLLLGQTLESVHIQDRHTFEQADDQRDEAPRPSAKVIPFPGRRRR